MATKATNNGEAPAEQAVETTPLLNIFNTINRIMVDVNPIGKNHRNEQQKFDYRGIDDMYNELHRLFAKHGLLAVPEEIIKEWHEERTTKSGSLMIYRLMHIRYRFYALDGSSITSVLQGEAQDSGDKASNKAQSIALKYALMHMFLIPTKEMIQDDPDGNSDEAAGKNQAKPNTDPEVIYTKEIKEQINNAPRRETLSEIFQANQGLHTNSEFIDDLNAKREEFRNAKNNVPA